eukprot:6195129-Pleurochrysis_carterae.AAC.1
MPYYSAAAVFSCAIIATAASLDTAAAQSAIGSAARQLISCVCRLNSLTNVCGRALPRRRNLSPHVRRPPCFNQDGSERAFCSCSSSRICALVGCNLLAVECLWDFDSQGPLHFRSEYAWPSCLVNSVGPDCQVWYRIHSTSRSSEKRVAHIKSSMISMIPHVLQLVYFECPRIAQIDKLTFSPSVSSRSQMLGTTPHFYSIRTCMSRTCT